MWFLGDSINCMELLLYEQPAFIVRTNYAALSWRSAGGIEVWPSVAGNVDDTVPLVLDKLCDSRAWKFVLILYPAFSKAFGMRAVENMGCQSHSHSLKSRALGNPFCPRCSSIDLRRVRLRD
jgi:hypothetical protein